MKKIFILLAISSLGINLISCKNSESKKAEELQAKLDSIALADSLKQVEREQNELAKAKMVEEEKNFTTPDLALFGLHGHVSSVSDRMYGRCCTYLTPIRLDFTENGDLVEYMFYENEERTLTFKFGSNGKSATRNGKEKFDVKRSNDGKLIEMTPNPKWEYWPEGGSYVFHYNKSGNVNAIDYHDEGGGPSLKVVKFNDQGLPLKIDMDGYPAYKYTFEYKEYDTHGNWTTCDVKVTIPAEYDTEVDRHDSFQLTRDINYYPNPLE